MSTLQHTAGQQVRGHRNVALIAAIVVLALGAIAAAIVATDTSSGTSAKSQPATAVPATFHMSGSLPGEIEQAKRARLAPQPSPAPEPQTPGQRP